MLKLRISLSLLQDLVNGMGSSDEDEDDEEDEVWRRLRYFEMELTHVCSSGLGKDDDESVAYEAGLGRVGHRNSRTELWKG
jgi:hypothetical protein